MCECWLRTRSRVECGETIDRSSRCGFFPHVTWETQSRVSVRINSHNLLNKIHPPLKCFYSLWHILKLWLNVESVSEVLINAKQLIHKQHSAARVHSFDWSVQSENSFVVHVDTCQQVFKWKLIFQSVLLHMRTSLRSNSSGKLKTINFTVKSVLLSFHLFQNRFCFVFYKLARIGHPFGWGSVNLCPVSNSMVDLTAQLLSLTCIFIHFISV